MELTDKEMRDFQEFIELQSSDFVKRLNELVRAWIY